MGRVFKRGNFWWVEFYHNGKQNRKSSKGRVKAVAQRLLQQIEGQIAEGRVPGVYFDRIRFDELADDYLTDYRVTGKRSVLRAEQYVKHLRKHFEGVRATAIDTPRIKKYIEARLSEEAAPATVNREVAALKRMFNLATKCTPPKIDRVPHFPMLRENNTRKGFFEHDEFVALRTALPEYLKGFVTFAYRSGWRLSEIANLTWRQVDLRQGIVTLNPGETKNDAARTLYLDNELKKVFAHQWRMRKRSGNILPYVFLNKRSTGRIKQFRKTWKRACEEAKIGEKLFHDFRRTAVRNMVRAGIPERVAMQVAGHKTRSVFDRYNIVSGADLREAAARQAAYLEVQASESGKDKIRTILDFPA